VTITRLPWYLLALVLVLAGAYATALLGLTLCWPDPLTGDEGWVRWMRAHRALEVLFGHQESCFREAEHPHGAWFMWLGSWGLWAAGAVVVAATLWEMLGREARATLRRSRGGHAILAGEPGEIDSLAAGPAAGRSVVCLARNKEAGRAIAWRRPFAEVEVLEKRAQAAALMQHHGAAKAAFIAAVTANDLANGELAEAALKAGGSGEMIVRLEQTAVRALKSNVLRRAAEQGGRKLTVVSLRQMQAREGLDQAMPGRYCDDNARRSHVAVCGAGPLLQELVFLTIRQGYGLEDALPLVSILKTGPADFTAGAFELIAQGGAAEVRRAEADAGDPAAIDRAFSGIALADAPLTAIHCCEGGEGGAAIELARRIERALVDLDVPVPPIVVHGDGPDNPGDTGMIRLVRQTDLADAREKSALLDLRAPWFHVAYLEGQQKSNAEFGKLPAEREWGQLPEAARDDNRNAADHVDYKLARRGYLAVRHADGPSFAEADLEPLARIEHARWMASRGLRGYRHGEKRDDTLLYHPDMKPYEQLDADTQRKDREQVGIITRVLAVAGQVPARLVPYGFLSKAAAADVLRRLPTGVREGILENPLAVIALDGAESIAVAEAARAAKVPVEVFLARMPEHVFAETQIRQRAVAVLRYAWRIRVVRKGTAADALKANSRVVVDAEGKVDQSVLA
jgi:hypothetical protein